jgi:hypothetical protein
MPAVGWDQLFVPYKMFRDRRYRYFLRIAILAATPHEYRQWLGWVESKMRFLVRVFSPHPCPAPDRTVGTCPGHSHGPSASLDMAIRS